MRATITIGAVTNPIFSNVEVFRQRVIKYFYVATAQTRTFTLTPIEALADGSPDLRYRYITLYKTTGNPIYNIFRNNGNKIEWNNDDIAYDSVTKLVSYTSPTLSVGFYVFIITFLDTADVSLSYFTSPF